jgi:RNA polymerase sigma-70 factor (ECF subfamily)
MTDAHTKDSETARHLAAAQGGDENAFSALAEPYRRELQVHCYRILGSLHEAEDMVQETMLKAWRRLDTYEGRASFRAWLYKIATNTCLDFLDQRRSRRLLPLDASPPSDPSLAILPPSAEVSWLDPFPDEWLRDTAAVNPEARYSDLESISLSFMTALQSLPPRQRAVLILRDVLDFSANETGEVLGITVSAANSALHRARVTLAQHSQEQEFDFPPSAMANDERTQWLLDQFVQAWETADVEGLVALLKEDATLAMPPSPSWYQGREAIRRFVTATIFGEGGMFGGQADGRWRLVRTDANASPAFALYQRGDENEYRAFGLLVLSFGSDVLSQIVSFIDSSLPARFNLPASITQ